MKQIKVGSLFSGIGGIDLGFKQAGFSIAWAIEKDHYCCETYRNNFHETHLFEKDVRKINAYQLPKVDIITAGFPCQSFSIGGHQRGFYDPRGNLFFEVLRFIQAQQPRFVFLENVSNLLQHDEGRTFHIIYTSLVEQGYFIKYKILRASDYSNIPQIRDRIYILAFREVTDCDRFVFPEPFPTAVTASDIIVRTVPVSKKYYYWGNDSFSIMARKTVTNKNAVYRVYHNNIKPIKNNMCPTLTASMGTQHNQVPLVIDNWGVRKLTPTECLTLQGFPKDFIFPPSLSDNEQYKQIGNSVCVPVVNRIAQIIKKLYDSNQHYNY